MNRKEFFRTGAGCCCAVMVNNSAAAADDNTAQLQREKEFIQNWLADLWEAIETEVDPKTRVKLMEATGRGCFRRFQFKRDIAQQGKGSLDKLLEAYKKNFEVWRDQAGVHIRYGEVSPGCYCPAARYRPAKPGDVHCECTRTTHQTIFETALEKPVKVEIVESVRRGGKTCHFLVHVA